MPGAFQARTRPHRAAIAHRPSVGRREHLGTSATTVANGAHPRPFYVKGLRWWIAILLMCVTIVNYLDRTCLSVAAPTLKDKLGINEKGFSYILVAFQLSYMFMQPLSGRIIDKLNIRVGLALSIVWWSAAQMLTAVAGGWQAFAFFRALLGIGEAGNFPSAAKAVSQWFRPSERTIAVGIVNVGSGLGAVIAPQFVVYMILRYGWQSAFVATGAVGILWVGLWLLVYRSPETHPWMSPEELAYIRHGNEELPVPEKSVERGVWRTVLASKSFWALAIARFLSEPAWQFFTYWIPLYLATERHLKLKDIAYFAWVPFLAADVGCLFGGFLSPFFIKLGSSVMKARKLSATTCGVLMVFAIFIGRMPTAQWAIVFFCIGAFAHQAMSSTLLTLPADLFPKSTVATANGLSGMFGNLGGMLFTLVVGAVAMTVGYGPLFVAIAFLDLIGAGVLWALLRDPDEARIPPQAAGGLP
jgi:MFS transporter, ACS family, hexuronate transporter